MPRPGERINWGKVFNPNYKDQREERLDSMQLKKRNPERQSKPAPHLSLAPKDRPGHAESMSYVEIRPEADLRAIQGSAADEVNESKKDDIWNDRDSRSYREGHLREGRRGLPGKHGRHGREPVGKHARTQNPTIRRASKDPHAWEYTLDSSLQRHQRGGLPVGNGKDNDRKIIAGDFSDIESLYKARD